MLTKAKFVLVGKFLAIKMKSEQIVRVLDLEGSAEDDFIDHVVPEDAIEQRISVAGDQRRP